MLYPHIPAIGRLALLPSFDLSAIIICMKWLDINALSMCNHVYYLAIYDLGNAVQRLYSKLTIEVICVFPMWIIEEICQYFILVDTLNYHLRDADIRLTVLPYLLLYIHNAYCHTAVLSDCKSTINWVCPIRTNLCACHGTVQRNRG
jgi:hypothetical protein